MVHTRILFELIYKIASQLYHLNFWGCNPWGSSTLVFKIRSYFSIRSYFRACKEVRNKIGGLKNKIGSSKKEWWSLRDCDLGGPKG